MLQPFHSIVADYEPQLERPESPTQGNLPVAIVDHRSGFGRLVAQIFRQHAQSLDEGFSVCDIKTIAVELGDPPLMRIKAAAVGKLQAGMDVTKFRTERGG